MAILKKFPNTIWLGGRHPVYVACSGGAGEGTCVGAIYPGMLCEEFLSSGVLKYRVHSTSDVRPVEIIVATEANHLNKTITEPQLDGDLFQGIKLLEGDKFMCVIPATTNITAIGTKLQSNGNGTMSIVTDGVGIVKALELTAGAVAAQSLLMVQVIGIADTVPV